jgi:hypothetical protein
MHYQHSQGRQYGGGPGCNSCLHLILSQVKTCVTKRNSLMKFSSCNIREGIRPSLMRAEQQVHNSFATHKRTQNKKDANFLTANNYHGATPMAVRPQCVETLSHVSRSLHWKPSHYIKTRSRCGSTNWPQRMLPLLLAKTGSSTHCLKTMIACSMSLQ